MARGRPSAGKTVRVSISMPSKVQKDLLMGIVACESMLRGCSKGQACFELVMGAIDVQSYPQPIRERLESLEKESSELMVAQVLRLSTSA